MVELIGSGETNKVIDMVTSQMGRTPHCYHDITTGPRVDTAYQGAAIEPEVVKVMDHEFVSVYPARTPTYCSACSLMLWGFTAQLCRCKYCSCTIHPECYENVRHQCPGSAINSPEAKYIAEKTGITKPHEFEVHTFLHPTFCDHCSILMKGLFKQGLRCVNCGTSCHSKCQQLIADLCGVNQKLKAEAIEQLDIRLPEEEPSVPEDKQLNIKLEDLEISEAGSSTNVEPTEICSLDDLDLLCVIGRGHFAKVYLGSLINKRKYYAVKSMKKEVVLLSNFTNYLTNERDILFTCRDSPFIVGLHCTFQTETHIFLTLEFLPGGDLDFHMNFGYPYRLSNVRTMFHSAEIICALEYLHLRNIIYRDLKLNNILLDAEGHIRLCDFGLAKIVSNRDGRTKTFCGPLAYTAPEVFTNRWYNRAVDWWALGVVMYNMLTGFLPFDNNSKDENDIKDLILSSSVVWSSHIKEEAKDLISLLLCHYPEQRMGMLHCPKGNIKDHPYFDIIDWEKLEKGKVQPPFRPVLMNAVDIQNFDPHITSEPIDLKSPKEDRALLASIDQNIFKDFAYTNADMERH